MSWQSIHFTLPHVNLYHCHPDYSLTPVAIATASHTHMLRIRGQGSWVVLVDSMVLCVSSYRLPVIQSYGKVIEKAACSSVHSSCDWNLVLVRNDDTYDLIPLFHMYMNLSLMINDQQGNFCYQIKPMLLSGKEGRIWTSCVCESLSANVRIYIPLFVYTNTHSSSS